MTMWSPPTFEAGGVNGQELGGLILGGLLPGHVPPIPDTIARMRLSVCDFSVCD